MNVQHTWYIKVDGGRVVATVVGLRAAMDKAHELFPEVKPGPCPYYLTTIPPAEVLQS